MLRRPGEPLNLKFLMAMTRGARMILGKTVQAKVPEAEGLRMEDSRKVTEPEARTVDPRVVQTTEKVLAIGRVSRRLLAPQEGRV